MRHLAAVLLFTAVARCEPNANVDVEFVYRQRAFAVFCGNGDVRCAYAAPARCWRKTAKLWRHKARGGALRPRGDRRLGI